MKVNGKDVTVIRQNGVEFSRVMRNGVELWGGTGLPSGYTLLEYIESTGSQYIDTGFKPNQDTRLVMDFENTGDYSSNSSGVAALFGARTGSSNSAFVVWVEASNVYPQYGNVIYSSNGSISINISQRLVYDLDKNILNIGTQSLSCTSYSFSTSVSLSLFTMNSNGTYDNRYAIGKLYSCQIYDNGTLVRDYVPCMNASNVCGLFDKINQSFYPSASSTAFTGA